MNEVIVLCLMNERRVSEGVECSLIVVVELCSEIFN